MIVNKDIKCDHCDVLVRGYDRNTHKERDHLCVKGKIEMHEFRKYAHNVTYGLPSLYEAFHFCDFTCLEAFTLQRKETLKQNRKEKVRKKLQEEANAQNGL